MMNRSGVTLHLVDWTVSMKLSGDAAWHYNIAMQTHPTFYDSPCLYLFRTQAVTAIRLILVLAMDSGVLSLIVSTRVNQ